MTWVRLRAAAVLFAASAALVVVPSALAVGGITITHAGLTHGHLTASWQGPNPATGPTLVSFPEDPFVQFASKPDVGTDGHFFSENVVRSDLLQGGARTYVDSNQLDPPTAAGTYVGYVRVDAWDNYLTWNSDYGLWDAGEVFSPVTTFNLTAVAERVVVRKGHYVYRKVHGKRRRVWVKPTYKTTLKWADS